MLYNSIKSHNQAIDILRSYDGKNPYILSIKNDVLSGKNLINDFNAEYVIKNKDVNPRPIYKIVHLADWYAQKKMEEWGTDFLPEKILIISYLGETDTCYHCYAQYRQSVNPSMMFLSKKGLLNDFLLEDYHSYSFDSERYNNLMHQKDKNRNLKEHQIEGVKFLLSRKKCILADDMGLGKMEPVSSLIPTPDGFKRMGDISVGDKIFGRNGKKYNVLNVYPHFNKEIYKVSFSDDTYCECGLEHLFLVRREKENQWETKSLQSLLDEELMDRNMNYKWEIPICDPVEYKEKDFEINPYKFGYNIHKFGKCIPNDYKISSISQRLSLLRGLMDANGFISRSNDIFYLTDSETLANDIKELVYSLGGIATIFTCNSQMQVKYQIFITIKENPFKNKNKADLYRKPQNNLYSKYIVSAEYVRNEDAKCLMVDSPDHTYLTGKSYIVTHNTTQLSVAAIEGNFDSVLIITPASLKTTWKEELEWFVPSRDITIIEGYLGKNKKELEEYLGYKVGKSGKKIKELQEEAKDRGKWEDNRFVIINYDILDEFYEFAKTKSKKDAEIAFENSPILKYIANKKSLIIIDECHKLSNNDSGRYKIIRNLIKKGKPDCLFLSTGTPITNNPLNYYNLLQLLDDPITRDWNYYVEHYCGSQKIPAKGEREKWTNIYLNWKHKENWYQLTNDEKNNLKDFISSHARMITIMKDATNLEELRDKTSHLYLRRMKEDLNDLPKKVVHEVFYEFSPQQKLEYSRLWEEYEHEKMMLDPTKELNKDLLEGMIYRKYCSNQMVPNTIRLTNHFISQGEKVIIACCYDEELYTLKDYFGDKCVIYNGKLNQSQKDDAKNAFINDKDKMVFIGNIDSASMGLTLTVSHIVIFNNISWQPALNSQMCDRVYRISQNHDCDIYYQMFSNTQYEHMWRTILKKELTINSIIKSEKDKK